MLLAHWVMLTAHRLRLRYFLLSLLAAIVARTRCLTCKNWTFRLWQAHILLIYRFDWFWAAELGHCLELRLFGGGRPIMLNLREFYGWLAGLWCWWQCRRRWLMNRVVNQSLRHRLLAALIKSVSILRRALAIYSLPIHFEHLLGMDEWIRPQSIVIPDVFI